MLCAFLVVCAALLAPICLAETAMEVNDIASHPFSVDFASGGNPDALAPYSGPRKGASE